MTTPLQIPIKYCKTLLASGSTFMTAAQAGNFFTKLVYEFWGFCVNGGTSLTQPGGFAAVNLPAGVQSGSSVLLAQGNDGLTQFGLDTFNSLSVNFEQVNGGKLIGKYLVTWVPGDSSTDDSVYIIKSVEDPAHIRVDVTSGGTRRLGNKTWFWDRQGINFRIVDFMAATNITGSGVSGSWSGSNMVLSMLSAPTVNPGQDISQVKFAQHASQSFGIQISPSGSWLQISGSFSDGAAEVTGSFFNQPSSVGLSTYTLIGGSDFLIAEVRSNNLQSGTLGSGFHVEIPQRMYSATADPNPVAWMLWQASKPSQIAASYYDGMNMVGRDGNVHQWTTLVRSPMGTNVRSDYTGNPYGSGQWQQFKLPNSRFWSVAFDSYGNSLGHTQYMTTDGVLSLPLAGQFSLARARLRHVRFTSSTLQRGSRIGDPITDPSGWVLVSNGVLWPWDNSILPLGPWWEGV